MIKLVIGLGNPGATYKQTRHNVGFLVVEHLVQSASLKWKRKFGTQSRVATWDVETGVRVVLAKPQTFMNRSGLAVAALMKKYGVNTDELLVVFDDLDLACGKIRIRQQGGAGGHNGLQSIIDVLGTKSFSRLRLGVGPRPDGSAQIDYVLGPFSEDQKIEVDKAIGESVEAIQVAMKQGISSAMNNFN